MSKGWSCPKAGVKMLAPRRISLADTRASDIHPRSVVFWDVVPGRRIELLTSSLPMTRTTTVLTGRIEETKSEERPKNGLHGFCTELYAFSCSVLRICAVLRRDSFLVTV